MEFQEWVEMVLIFLFKWLSRWGLRKIAPFFPTEMVPNGKQQQASSQQASHWAENFCRPLFALMQFLQVKVSDMETEIQRVLLSVWIFLCWLQLAHRMMNLHTQRTPAARRQTHRKAQISPVSVSTAENACDEHGSRTMQWFKGFQPKRKCFLFFLLF